MSEKIAWKKVSSSNIMKLQNLGSFWRIRIVAKSAY
jgi:hypothetical protein